MNRPAILSSSLSPSIMITPTAKYKAMRAPGKTTMPIMPFIMPMSIFFPSFHAKISKVGNNIIILIYICQVFHLLFLSPRIQYKK